MCLHLLRPYSLLMMVLCLVAIRPAAADFSQIWMFSVEWLVDNSDVIAVVNYPQGRSPQSDDADPEILQSIKGDGETLRWPLTPLKEKGHYSQKIVQLGPRDNSVRVVFGRGPSTLLQEITLVREMEFFHGPVPLQEMVYGVSQTGELFMTQADLMRAIKNRMEVGPEQPVEVFKERGSEKEVWAPSWFPLNSTKEVFMLTVPWDTHYRDALIHLAKTGNAAERMYAADLLSWFLDPLAKKTLEELSQVKEVTIAYRRPLYHGSERPNESRYTSRDVRLSAEGALKELAERTAAGAKKLELKH